MNSRNIPLFTPWSVLQILLALGAIGVAIWKLMYGLGAVTNLSDNWPWGLWVGFDVGGYIAVAAGGFSLAAIVYILQLEKFRPIVKPAILIGLLFYTIAAIGIFTDIGRSPLIVHPIWMWQPYSVMFEVAWCVMLYTTVLLLEFSPNIMQRFSRETLLKLHHYILIPLVIMGIILSFLHQSSLGALLLITPDMHPLWYGPLMGYLFFVSAIAAGLATVTLFVLVCSKAWKLTLRMDVLSKIGTGIAWVLATYLVVRFIELFATGNISALAADEFGLLFFFEVGVFMALPMALLFSRLRKSPAWLTTASLLVVIGVTLNRLNTLVIAHAPVRVGGYFPSATEILFTVGLIAGAMYAFRLAAKYLPVFSDQHAGLPEAARETPPEVVPA